MGWISDRHMRNGGTIGGRYKGRSYPKDGAPLRKIARVIRPAQGMFDTAWVVLECGHEGRAWGSTRARCPGCKPSSDGAASSPDPAAAQVGGIRGSSTEGENR